MSRARAGSQRSTEAFFCSSCHGGDRNKQFFRFFLALPKWAIFVNSSTASTIQYSTDSTVQYSAMQQYTVSSFPIERTAQQADVFFTTDILLLYCTRNIIEAVDGRIARTGAWGGRTTPGLGFTIISDTINNRPQWEYTATP